MKFYRGKNNSYFLRKIVNNKLNAIYFDYIESAFYKNGLYHNTKNAACINYFGYKEFLLNDISYGNHNNFTKYSWRRFVKMQVFL